MFPPSLSVTFEERRAIWRIANRVLAIPIKEFGNQYRISVQLMLCHANGCPLRLHEMAKGDLIDIVHDLAGLRDHLDVHTGKLDGRFMPRWADHRRRS